MNSPAATVDCEGAPDLIELVQSCLPTRRAIVDYGVAHCGMGNPPPTEHVKLRQHGGVLEHYERDMSVRVAAGMKWGDLQKQLATVNQFVPIDADDDLTVGEVINHNVYGPLRVSFGASRDLLLGLSYIDGNAQNITVGGRTVKNVAGYDVTRLMVGSLGELGLIHEATLRTYAIPQHVMIIDISVKHPPVIDHAMTSLLISDAAPAFLSSVLEPDGWVVRVGYLGTSTACAVQQRSLETFVDTLDDTHIVGSGGYEFEQTAQQRAAHRLWRRTASAVVKLVVPPTSTGSICQQLQQWARDNVTELQIDALPVHGCVFAGGDLTPQQARDLDTDIMDMLGDAGGLRVWHQRPDGTTEIAPFAPPQPDWPTLSRIKATMDPANIFNPGRFLKPQENAS